MENEETKEEETETPEVVDKPLVDDGGTGMADKAIAAAERLEKANEVTATHLDRREKLMAREALGGRSAAGQEVIPKTQEELDEEAAKKFMQEDEE